MTDTKPEYELYPSAEDTFQLNNIVEFNSEIVINFNNVLKEWQKETNDNFDDPDRNDLEKMIDGKRNGLKEWII